MNRLLENEVLNKAIFQGLGIAMNDSSPNTKLPIFVYGALKVNEIAWHQIKLYVESASEATLQDYELRVSDGVGFAAPHIGKFVQGFLIKFKSPDIAYEKISKFEGVKLNKSRYKWTQVIVSGTPANLLELRGKLPSYAEASSWGLHDDEVFSKGIPWLHDTMKLAIAKLRTVAVPGLKPQSYWESYFQLQGCFLFMWGVQERLELFRFGVTDDEKVLGSSGRVVSARSMKARREEMGRDPLFQDAVRAANIDQTLEVRDSRIPTGDSRISSRNPLSTWYEIRNNITHHAKGSERDIEKLVIASADNFNALFHYLRLISPRLAKEWGHLTAIEKSV